MNPTFHIIILYILIAVIVFLKGNGYVNILTAIRDIINKERELFVNTYNKAQEELKEHIETEDMAVVKTLEVFQGKLDSLQEVVKADQETFIKHRDKSYKNSENVNVNFSDIDKVFTSYGKRFKKLESTK